MRIVVDKYFIQELNKEGYDLTYKKLIAIYRKSREKASEFAINDKLYFDTNDINSIIAKKIISNIGK